VLCAGRLCSIWHNNIISNNNEYNNNNIKNNNNNNEYNIKVSIMLVFMRGGSRVSTVSIFYWLHCLKVAVKVKDIVFDKLTILFLFNY